jgi:transcriptional regulator with XRE-family HTH domain
MAKQKTKTPTPRGRAIRAARLAKGWSQQRLAQAIGCQQPDISAIETGARTVGLDRLIRIGDVLGLSLVIMAETVAYVEPAAIRLGPEGGEELTPKPTPKSWPTRRRHEQ